MSTTVNALALRLITEQGESTDDTDFVTQVEAWINDALQEIALAINGNPFRDKTTINTDADEDQYTLPSGAKEVIQMRFVDNGEPLYLKTIQEISLKGFDLTDTGRPIYWIEDGLSSNLYRFRLYPIPDDDYDIEVSYYFQPSEVASGSNIPVQDQYIQVIIDRVRMHFALRERDYEGFDRLQQRFEKNISILVIKESRRTNAFTYLRPNRLINNRLPEARYPSNFPYRGY